MTKSVLTWLILCAFWITHSEVSFGQEWSGLRGDDGLGTLSSNGILSRTSDVKLVTKWKKSLGSGYSSVVVAEGRIITMYSGASEDFLVCLNESNGEQIWEFAIGPKFVGENGSFDGPCSTPLIYQGSVFAVSPRGVFYCVSLDEGREQWKIDLVADLGAKKPLYGFVTSPIAFDQSVILQTGIPDKSLAAFQINDGKLLWSVSNDRIDSQTPTRVSMMGKEVILAAGGNNLSGVDASSGELLFSYPHKGGNGSAMSPVPIGKDKMLLTLDDSFSSAVLLRQVGEKIEVSEAWQNRSIKNTYNIPCLSDDSIYGFSTRVLTCVDPETGRPIWKSRKPGDGFLVTVDGHMIINTKKGSLHLAKAHREGYDEIAQLNLFEDLVWSVPAYHDDSIYVRSLGEIARVDIIPSSEKSEIAESTSMPLGSEFAALVNKIQSTDDNQQKSLIADQWFESQSQLPFIEDDIVHFIYRGDEKDIALAGDLLGARQEKQMKRLEGTRLSYLSMRLPRDQRANYVFLVNFKPQVDSKNSRQTTSSMYAGEMEFAVRLAKDEPLKMSWFAMPDWQPPKYLTSLPSDLNGQLVDQTLASEVLDQEIKFQVYLPPDYESSDSRYPVAYVADGGALKLGNMAAAVDNSDFRDAIVVFVAPAGGPQFASVLATELVPMVDKEFRTRAERGARLICGFGFSGGGALIMGGQHNDLFGSVAVQSPLAFAAQEKMIAAAFAGVKLPTNVLLQWGRFDMFNPHENWDLREGSEKIYKIIAGNEHVTVKGGVVNDSTDWASWRNRFDEMFALLEN